MTNELPPLHVTMDGLEIVDARASERYEGRLVNGAQDGEPAIAVYALDGKVIAFQHTEVPLALEGQGVARRLVQAALDDVRARGLTVVPNCGYVRSFIARHPAYRALVHPLYAARVGDRE